VTRGIDRDIDLMTEMAEITINREWPTAKYPMMSSRDAGYQSVRRSERRGTRLKAVAKGRHIKQGHVNASAKWSTERTVSFVITFRYQGTYQSEMKFYYWPTRRRFCDRPESPSEGSSLSRPCLDDRESLEGVAPSLPVVADVTLCSIRASRIV
jgi:hypothetical protein